MFIARHYNLVIYIFYDNILNIHIINIMKNNQVRKLIEHIQLINSI